MSRAALNLALLVLAVVLVGTAVWQWRQQQVPPTPAPQRSDYVLRDFEMTAMDSLGRESFTVRGPYLQRDVAGRSISLVQPRFSFPDAGGGRWNARSDAAWVSPDADMVKLLDQVRMVGPPSPAGISTRLETERLTVFPDRNEATSEHRVTLTQGDSILTGTGLRADMQAKRFQLLSDVKGRYAPRGP